MSAIEVILVDKNDAPTGKMEKLEVHEKGLLHRAVTVYVFNRKGEFLLQRRAASKYHCVDEKIMIGLQPYSLQHEFLPLLTGFVISVDANLSAADIEYIIV